MRCSVIIENEVFSLSDSENLFRVTKHININMKAELLLPILHKELRLTEMLDAETIKILNDRKVPLEKVPAIYKQDVAGSTRWIVTYPKQVVEEFDLTSATKAFKSMEEAEADFNEKVKAYVKNWKIRAKSSGEVRSGRKLKGIEKAKLAFKIKDFNSNKVTIRIWYKIGDGTVTEGRPLTGTCKDVLANLKKKAVRYGDDTFLKALKQAEKTIERLHVDGERSLKNSIKRLRKNLSNWASVLGKGWPLFVTAAATLLYKWWNEHRETTELYLASQSVVDLETGDLSRNVAAEEYYSNRISAINESLVQGLAAAVVTSGVFAMTRKSTTAKGALSRALKDIGKSKVSGNGKVKQIVINLAQHGLVVLASSVAIDWAIGNSLDDLEEVARQNIKLKQQNLPIPIVKMENWATQDVLSKDQYIDIINQSPDAKVLNDMSDEEFEELMKEILD